ncbi:MAG TPA: four helix bundle protein [Roseiarcus sp.]|nr:four helix bundle protein [Roseiarcus sp.]
MANSEWSERLGSLDIKSYRDLRVWQEAMVVAAECYVLTKGFPREEAYGMTAQVRRAAASIAANIAEEHGRETKGSFVQFLRMSQGQLKELETHLLLAGRVGISEPSSVETILDRCEALGKMLRRLIRSLQNKPFRSEERPGL